MTRREEVGAWLRGHGIDPDRVPDSHLDAVLGYIGEPTYTDADRFLMLLRDHPTLLPAVTGPATAAAVEHRSQDEIHSCLRCPDRAATAIIADTTTGKRWLDLCMACYSWLQAGATPHL